MQREYGVSLDPASEVIHCIGSKPALAMLPAAFINPGDVTLMTVPGYPVAGTHTRYYGGEVHKLPLSEEDGWLPRLDDIPAVVAASAIAGHIVEPEEFLKEPLAELAEV